MKRIDFAVAGIMALTVVAITGMAVSWPAGAQEPARTETDPDTVVARVGEAVIRAADVSRAYDELPEQYRQLPLSVLYKQLLEQLINRQLMLKAGLDEKLDQAEDVRAQVREFRDFTIQRTYLDRFIAKTVTDDALQDEYDATIGAEAGKEQVKASHILLQTEDEAIAIIEELGDGADFATLARDKSTGPSASKGGDLGFFNREQMVAPFAEVAFAMEEGQTSSSPVKTQFGWHVIKVTGRRTQPPPAFEEVREQIFDQLTRDALEAHMTELRGATTVERFNPDGTPMEADAAR